MEAPPLVAIGFDEKGGLDGGSSLITNAERSGPSITVKCDVIGPNFVAILFVLCTWAEIRNFRIESDKSSNG